MRWPWAVAWIWDALVTVDADAVSELPVGQVRRPFSMQSFYFATGLGEPACQEAADALVVQSPQGVSVAFTINGLDINIGSTVIFTTVQTSAGDTALVGALLEGHLAVPDFNLQLAESGEVFAITLNEEGLVDGASQVIEPPADAVGSLVANACQNAASTGLVEERGVICDTALIAVSPYDAPTPEPVPAQPDDNPLARVGLDDACTVAAINTVNQRGGPGINYPLQGQLGAGQVAYPDGCAEGADGFRWWRLDTGAWLRSDLVNSGGNCATIASVEVPQPSDSQAEVVPDHNFYAFIINDCMVHSVSPRLAPSGRMLRLDLGIGWWPTLSEAEAAVAGHSASISVDGNALNVYYVGIEAPDGGYVKTAFADWVASSGVHTFSGSWTTGFSNSCTVTIE